MSTHRYRGRSRVLALVCGLSATAAASLVVAQEKPDEEKALTEVVVTGSRIVRAGFDTLEPASVVTAEYIESRGLTNIADALNETPGFGTGVTPEGGQSTFGPGLNFVNRFGLGSNRTLTLVNGRRFVSSNAPSIFGPAAPGNQVDLNFIPTVLLESVESLTVGGAPTYGSDAIAGVVNVKLKRNYEGIRAFGQYGQLWDGGLDSNSLGLVGGWNFAGDRGNFTASVQHSEVSGMRAVDNPRFARALSYATNPRRTILTTQPGRRTDSDGRVNGDVPFDTALTDGIPNAVLIHDRRIFQLNFGGVALPTGANNLADGRLRCFGATNTSCLQFDRSGNLVPYNTGNNFGTQDASGGDGLYLVQTLQLASDLERTSATSSVHFDINDNVQVFADLFAYKSDALEIVDQTAYNATIFGSSSSAITLPADHPMMTQQARTTLAGLGVTSFRISRAHRDLAQNNARSENELYQGVVGATGDFELGSRRFNWEAYFNYGRNDTTYFSTQLNRQKFVNALNVVNVGGTLQCSPTPGYASLPASGGRVQVGADLPVADPNCVPLDIFGEGRPSAAAVAYVSSVQRSDAVIKQQVFNANIGSQIFDIWGGPIEYNVGFERRKESGEFTPDAYLAAGLGRSAQITPNSGEYSTNEFFGELIVPLVSKDNAMPALHELTITGKGRRVDNSVNGKFTAWTGGLQWSPIEGLQLRGNVTRSLRAPSLTELFTPVAPLFTFVNDPCSSTLITTGSKPATRQANCAQFFQEYGIPANPAWVSNAVGASVQGSLKGDAGLANETANAWTAGFVLRPSWLEGFQMAVDWVDIRIDDTITNFTANDLASGCFDNDTYPNDYCNFFTRNAPGSALPGQITFARTGYANGAYQSMAGVTLEGGYRHEIGKLGTFEVAVSYYRLREELRSALGITVTNSEEQLGSPTDTAQVNLIWEKGPFGARWQTNYVGKQLYNRTFNADSRDILEVNGDFVHNLSLYVEPVKNATLRLAVTNVLDGKPPFPISGDSFNGNYDFLGRRYSLSVTYDLDSK